MRWWRWPIHDVFDFVAEPFYRTFFYFVFFAAHIIVADVVVCMAVAIAVLVVTVSEFYCCWFENEMRKIEWAHGDRLQTEIRSRKIRLSDDSSCTAEWRERKSTLDSFVICLFSSVILLLIQIQINVCQRIVVHDNWELRICDSIFGLSFWRTTKEVCCTAFNWESVTTKVWAAANEFSDALRMECWSYRRKRDI